MEFEELQKIWIEGNDEPVYAINEKALHNRIVAKKKTALHIANVSELLLIVLNFCAGGFVFALNFRGGTTNIFMYVMVAWMVMTAVYVLISRMRRLHEQPKFDRSMREDLRHAIFTAGYQVRLSQIMRLNILPIGVLVLLGVWNAGKPVWISACLLLFFAVGYYFSGRENNVYRNKKRELELLQSKLESEES